MDVITGSHLDQPILAARLRRYLHRPAKPAAADIEEETFEAEPPPAEVGKREPVLKVGKLQLWPDRYTARVCGERLDLSLREFQLLCALARRPNWVVPRAQLEAGVGGRDDHTGIRAIDNLVYRLRKKLGSADIQLCSVRGVGYRLRHGPQ